MNLLRRLVLVASIVFCGSMALAASAGAAGGGPPGSESSFSATSASANPGSKSNPGPFSLFVSHNQMSFSGGKATEVTQVFLFLTDSNSAGCLEIPGSDFTVGKNLQSAHLKTTLTKDNKQCQGKGFSAVNGGAKPLAPAGPPPVPNPLPLPITIDIMWAGNGIVGTSHDSHSFECADYSTSFTSTNRTTLADATGTISAFAGSFDTASANISSDQSHQQTEGIVPAGCFPV